MDASLEALRTLLETKPVQVPVGDRNLTVRALTVARHEEFGAAFVGLDFAALIAAAKPILESISSADPTALFGALMASGPDIVRQALEFLGPKGGATINVAAQISLDHEGNHDILKSGKLIESDPTREAGVYISSPGLRTWVRHSCTLPQALHVVLEAAKLTGYPELGKALKGSLRGLWEPAATPPEKKNGSGETVRLKKGA